MARADRRARAKALLERKAVAFTEILVDQDPSQRAEMVRRSGRRTVPQIFIGETHVGGCDDLVALDRSGGLAPPAPSRLRRRSAERLPAPQPAALAVGWW